MVVFDARLVHQHLLEAALQRGVLLDVLAVFVQRGGADAVQLAARQRRLEHVAGVDGALGLAGADHGVDLVDEQDDAALVLRHFLEHRLQALLELAAVLGAGQQAGHVEHQHLLALQGFGHFAIDDALGQAFDDGRLADARLADQHRVVLGAALQDLDGAADLVVAADHRVELALARRARSGRCSISSATRAGPRPPGAVHALAAAHGHRWPLPGPCGPGRAAWRGGRFRPCRRHRASRNISLAMNWSPRFCASLSVRLSRLPRSRPTDTSPPWPSTLGRRVSALLKIALQARHIDAGARQQRGGATVVLAAAAPASGAAAR